MSPLAETSIFTGQFKQAFASTGINSELVSVLAWVLGTTLLILGSNMIYRKITAKFRTQKKIDTIEGSKKIIDLLGICLEENSRFEITFNGHIIKGQGIFCSLISVDKNALILEIPDYIAPRKAWLEHLVEVYFSTTSTGRTPTYYTFTSSVQAIETNNGEFMCLRIALPEAIRLGQRRMHFRLVPPPEFIPKAQIWFFPHESRIKNHSGPASWGDPRASFNLALQPEVINSLEIKDISAGGCRVTIRDNGDSQNYLDTTGSPDVFIHLTLKQAENTYATLYLLGKIRIVFSDPITQELSLGLQFLLHGHPANNTLEYITWHPISTDEGLPEVGNWVFKHHMEIFRKKEQEKEKNNL